MKKQFIICALTFYLILFLNSNSIHALTLSPLAARKMGEQIWKNECGGKIQGLTSWNEGEEFASLGIGHFIWYPSHVKPVFKQTFPFLLKFYKLHGVSLPKWLELQNDCPWNSREEFLKDQNGSEMIELRQLLTDHVDLQVHFMVDRLKKALPEMIIQLDENQKKHITAQFYRLAQTEAGIFVLLDYLNFKGEGLSPSENYQGHRWGLIQVLHHMSGKEGGNAAILEFIDTAKKILAKRVELSPQERNEKRWLKGWYNRLDSYAKYPSEK